MNGNGEIRARDREHANQVLREVCADFDAALGAAASGAVGERYAAVPSWYATASSPACGDVPSWCIDAPTARRLLGEIHRSDQRRDQ